MRRPARLIPLRRSIDRFTSDPASLRNAARLMIGATVVIVLLGGLVVWIFDSKEFPDYGSALWYTLQTVTTVGYGDKVPTGLVGRLTGSFVMIVSVALLAIVTALITSTFVEAAQRRRHAEEQDPARALDVRLDEITARLTLIERSLEALVADRSTRSRPDPPWPVTSRRQRA